MIKFLFTFLLLVSSVMAKSYHFSEERYSDALAKSINLEGIISFGNASLEIHYEESDNRLVYEDEELTRYESDEEVELDENEALKIAQYFEIIILLYEDDKEKLQEEFTSDKMSDTTTLFPKGEMKEYIKKILLVHQNDDLKSLKLYLNNDDTIKISIEDEVR